MKAQVAVEYLMIISFALIVITSVSLYVNQFFIGYNEDTKLSLATNAVKKLGESANWVFFQGPPAKITSNVCIPDGITEPPSLDNKMIQFKVKTSAGISDIYFETIPELQGSIPQSSGCYHISLTAHENYVNIAVV